MKRAIFFEGSLQKWTITCSCLCALSLTFTLILLIFLIKKITYLLSTYRKRHLICREARLLHFLINFSDQNRTIFNNGLSGRHFLSFGGFLKYFYQFLIWFLAGRKKKKVPACVSKMCCSSRGSYLNAQLFSRGFHCVIS